MAEGRGQRGGGVGWGAGRQGAERPEGGYQRQMPEPRRPAPIRTPRGDPEDQDQPPTPRARDVPANPFAADGPEGMGPDLDW